VHFIFLDNFLKHSILQVTLWCAIEFKYSADIIWSDCTVDGMFNTEALVSLETLMNSWNNVVQESPQTQVHVLLLTPFFLIIHYNTREQCGCIILYGICWYK
jgi:hypothetical protein